MLLDMILLVYTMLCREGEGEAIYEPWLVFAKEKCILIYCIRAVSSI